MIAACILSLAVLAGSGGDTVRLKPDTTGMVRLKADPSEESGFGSISVGSAFRRTVPVGSAFRRTGEPPQQPPVHDHAAHMKMLAEQPKEPIPELTDADRKAAFPEGLHGHATHDRAIHFYSLFDHLEWQAGSGNAAEWANKTWIGGDIDRVWLRTKGEAHDGRIESASVHALWGRAIAPWWDVVMGVRQDFRPGDPQTWAAIGIQGLAPYWFEVEATGYVGAGGRTAATFEVEYELLFTNRLILQPVVELELHGKSDPERGIGRGLSSIESGLRLRYEIRREFAPYIGVTWERKLFGTADLAREQGDRPSAARLAFGVRTWF